MQFRCPIPTLLVCALAVGVHLFPAATSRLQFDRSALANGEGWRLITAHLTHFDANHLAWDVAALLGLGLICESISRRGVAVALGSSSIAVSVAVWLFQPQFETYRGLSGIACALFGLFATSLIQRRTRATLVVGVAALIGVGAKCIFEINTGSTAFASGIGYSPVPLAHLVGVVCGIGAALLTGIVVPVAGVGSAVGAGLSRENQNVKSRHKAAPTVPINAPKASSRQVAVTRPMPRGRSALVTGSWIRVDSSHAAPARDRCSAPRR